MGNYNRDRGGRPGGGRGFSSKGGPASGWERRGFSGRGSSGPAQMFQTTCDKCHMNCEVPFRPTNGRPVYCSNCFSAKGGPASGWESRRPSFGGEDRQMFDATCDECHNSCQVPFKPSSDKPIYCSNCFGDKRRTPGGSREQSQNNDQLAEVHAKLDKILSLLGSNTTAPAVALEAVEEIVEQAPQEVVSVEEVKPAKKKSPKKK